MHIKSIKRKSVSEEVFDQIKDNIVKGVWKEAEKIPSENELCKIFNVSRVSVRSAIQKLQAVGILTTNQGQGSFVSTSMSGNILNGFIPLLNINTEEFRDILEFREALEFKSIDLAVDRATEADLSKIGDALENMIKHRENYKEFTRFDYEFHLNIVKASKNKIFISIMQSYKSIFINYLEEMNKVYQTKDMSLENHKNIYDALLKGDNQRAKSIIRKSMDTNLKRFRRKKD